MLLYVTLPFLSCRSRQLCKVLCDTRDLGSQTYSVSEALLLTSIRLPDKPIPNFQSLVSYLLAAYVSSVTQETTVFIQNCEVEAGAQQPAWLECANDVLVEDGEELNFRGGPLSDSVYALFGVTPLMLNHGGL